MNGFMGCWWKRACVGGALQNLRLGPHTHIYPPRPRDSLASPPSSLLDTIHFKYSYSTESFSRRLYQLLHSLTGYILPLGRLGIRLEDDLLALLLWSEQNQRNGMLMPASIPP
jgi:hypothetical protein